MDKYQGDDYPTMKIIDGGHRHENLIRHDNESERYFLDLAVLFIPLLLFYILCFEILYYAFLFFASKEKVLVAHEADGEDFIWHYGSRQLCNSKFRE